MANKSSRRSVHLRVTDQETVRIITIHRRGRGETLIGAGTLIGGNVALTCCHVVDEALKRRAKRGDRVPVVLRGAAGQPRLIAKVVKVGRSDSINPSDDWALLRLIGPRGMTFNIPTLTFAAPLRHSGKSFSVLGFPDGDPQGRHTTGQLHAADAYGLVQMDARGNLLIKGGYSGAPVWCPELSAFVGIVVTAQQDRVSWCIPSNHLVKVVPGLQVKFRMPPSDRPVINDFYEDEPNVELFGPPKSVPGHSLRMVEILPRKKNRIHIGVKYVRKKGASPIGKYVTFILHPSFAKENEDAYELFAKLKKGVAEQDLFTDGPFVLAAVADGGNTALTIDLAKLKGAKVRLPKWWREQQWWSDKKE